MKTIQEIKEEVAEGAGYKNWDFFMYTFTGFGAHVQPYNDEVAKRYAEEAIKVAAGKVPWVNRINILNIINELK